MRSFDDRMLEEINRKVCDHCSDLLFVYHKDYQTNLLRENINNKKIFVVGNTIVEPLNYFKKKINNLHNFEKFILVDIHRPENFKYKKRLQNIIKYLRFLKKTFKVKIKFLSFGRTLDYLQKFKINTRDIIFQPLVGYKEFIKLQQNSFFIVSDSGTAQEEPALLNVPVLVPRDYTERPQSYFFNCSFKIDMNSYNSTWNKSIGWIKKHKSNKIKCDTKWLGNGSVSEKIVKILKQKI